MTVADLLNDAARAGVTLSVADDGSLDVGYDDPRPDAVLALLKTHKRAVASVVAGREPAVCAGCSVRLCEGIAGCGWRDCPHRAR